MSSRFWVDDSHWFSIVLGRLTPIYTIWRSVVTSCIILWKKITVKPSTFDWLRIQIDSLKFHLWKWMCFTAVFYLLCVPFSCNPDFVIWTSGPDFFNFFFSSELFWLILVDYLTNMLVGFRPFLEVTLRRKDLEWSFQTPLQYHGLLRSPGTYIFNKKEKEE